MFFQAEHVYMLMLMLSMLICLYYIYYMYYAYMAYAYMPSQNQLNRTQSR